MEINWLKTDERDTDERDTGEHFLGALTDQPDDSTTASARRVADLSTQVEFLDREITRYRDLVANERIRHQTELADMQLESDTRLDQARRQARHENQAIHDSYRALLNTRLAEHDEAFTEARNASAAELVDQRRRQQERLDRLHDRRLRGIEANHKQQIDEINESNQRDRQAIESEIVQGTATIERLQAEIVAQVARTDRADANAASAARESAAIKHQMERTEKQHQLRIDEADQRVANATSQVEAERRRSAATLAELLERSASVAAEADKARSNFAAEQAKAEQATAQAWHRAQLDYQALEAATDERASHAIAREIELEGAIAELRNQLKNYT